MPQALPQLLFQLWRNISQRYFEPVALSVGGQLLAKFRDFRLQGSNERGQHASQAVFGELLFEFVEKGLRGAGRSLRFGQNGGAGRQFLRRL